MAGNVWDWTIESMSGWSRIVRGGSSGLPAPEYYPASSRSDGTYALPTQTGRYGSRSCLYIAI